MGAWMDKLGGAVSGQYPLWYRYRRVEATHHILVSKCRSRLTIKLIFRSLQLATFLYKEYLLDVDHFLDWILHSLAACTSERLFIWLLIVSIPAYWKDITSCRIRGKRLAEALLSHSTKASISMCAPSSKC